MPVTEKEFKKLLIDLDTSLSEIGRALGKSPWTVQLYFRGTLRNEKRRGQIKAFLEKRARKLNVDLPEFWAEEEIAAS
jgi:hypothetical protein